LNGSSKRKSSPLSRFKSEAADFSEIPFPSEEDSAKILLNQTLRKGFPSKASSTPSLTLPSLFPFAATLQRWGGAGGSSRGKENMMTEGKLQ